MHPRCLLTAFVVTSPTEAFVAWRRARRPKGPNGESWVAVILHTQDAGETWVNVPFPRRWWTRLGVGGLPDWPPELVLELRVVEGVLTAVHRDEWVIYEPGGEHLWLSSREPRGTWSHHCLRRVDYESADAPGPVHAVAPPPGFRMPSEDEVLRTLEP